MGTWDAKLLGNDTAAQTYESFYRQYDAGEAISTILTKVEREMRASLKDADDCSHVELALALASWECASLDRARLDRVRTIVHTGSDLAAHQRLGADAAFLRKRKKVLSALLAKIEKRNTKPRPRKPPPSAKSPFRAGCCFAILRPATTKRGPTYYGFWIATASLGRTYGDFGIVCLDVVQRDLPTLEECTAAFVRGITKGSQKGTYEGDQELYGYDGDRAACLAAFAERAVLIGHTAPAGERKVLWGSSGHTLDWSKSKNLVARLLRQHEEAKAKRLPRRIRLGELVRAG